MFYSVLLLVKKKTVFPFIKKCGAPLTVLFQESGQRVCGCLEDLYGRGVHQHRQHHFPMSWEPSAETVTKLVPIVLIIRTYHCLTSNK